MDKETKKGGKSEDEGGSEESSSRSNDSESDSDPPGSERSLLAATASFAEENGDRESVGSGPDGEE